LLTDSFKLKTTAVYEKPEIYYIYQTFITLCVCLLGVAVCFYNYLKFFVIFVCFADETIFVGLSQDCFIGLINAFKLSKVENGGK